MDIAKNLLRNLGLDSSPRPATGINLIDFMHDRGFSEPAPALALAVLEGWAVSTKQDGECSIENALCRLVLDRRCVMLRREL